MKKLREFADTEGSFSDSGDSPSDTKYDVSTRTSRSDEGILSLTNAVLNDIFGLNDETRSRILKIIRAQGQFQQLKQTIRQMPGVAHRRLNDVVNMARQASTDPEAAKDAEEHGEEGFNANANPGEYDHEGHGRNNQGGTRFEFEEERAYEGKKMSFAGYLINELSYDEKDLRDPEQKQDIMRMMRSGDAQAEQLATRGNREQKRDRREEITQEKDPQKAQLLRKKQTLLKQIAMIDAQMQGHSNPNQAADEQY